MITIAGETVTVTTSTTEEQGTRNEAVDPWPWTAALGFASGMLVPTPARTLYLAGQAALDASGAVVAAGDMAGQLARTMDNVETVLAAAGMTLSDVVRYDVYTIDMAAYFAAAGELVGRFAAAGVVPCGGIAAQVTGLAMPGLMVEVVCTAAR
jgi:enamine deaminase RidA (YjgF/YER057c/UK114 family)